MLQGTIISSKTTTVEEIFWYSESLDTPIIFAREERAATHLIVTYLTISILLELGLRRTFSILRDACFRVLQAWRRASNPKPRS